MSNYTGEAGKPPIGIDRPHSVFRAADDFKYRKYILDGGELGREEWVKAGKPKGPEGDEKKE